MVAAGKGGVGKSTISVILAQQLSMQGHKVGILDADIYGPSIPTILEIEDSVPMATGGVINPIIKDKISVASIAFLVPQDSAIAWRGPMLSKAINQLLGGTNWGDLDYLIIDMPPGTGDIHISFINTKNITGAIMVSTPDKLAIRDVTRAIDLYKKTGINIVGIIENMSYLKTTNEDITPFGEGYIKALAEHSAIPIIAKLPMIPSLSARKNFYLIPELQINFVL